MATLKSELIGSDFQLSTRSTALSLELHANTWLAKKIGQFISQSALRCKKQVLTFWLQCDILHTLRPEPSFSPLLDRAREKWRLCLNRLWSHRSPHLWTCQSCFLSSNWFSSASIPFNEKPMVTTEPAIPAHGYWAWVSKLYPSNIQRMLNKDLTRFTSTPKSSTWKKDCWQDGFYRN